MLIDTHVHLDLPQFDSDRGQVIQRARDAGIELLLAVAMAHPDRPSIAKTLELAERHDFIFAAVGIHPHYARDADAAYIEEIGRQLDHPKAVLWGEIGLDYHYRNSPPDRQRSAFRSQLRVAREKDLPVVIHCRDAWADMLAILKEEAAGKKYRGILHNFAGDPGFAAMCADMGLLISFSGIITFHGSEQTRDAAAGLRLDQILIETDAPYVAPAPHRGQRNEPSFLHDVAEGLARAMDVTVEDIARNTSRNFRNLVMLPELRGNDVLVYAIRDRLYINLTNRCTAHCVFCRRKIDPVASGYDLYLAREHTPEEYLEAIGDPGRHAELIFCGFGEPTIRLPELLAISRALKARGCRLRMNTNGHGNLIHGRDIVPDLAPYLDEISISIDAGDAESYTRIVRPDFGAASFEAVIDFVRACVGKIPKVTLTAVEIPNLNLAPIEKLARDLGIDFRAREYQPMVGSTDFTKTD